MGFRIIKRKGTVDLQGFINFNLKIERMVEEMKKLFVMVFLCLVFAIPACVVAGPVTAEWDLSIDDQYLGATGGYRLYVGTASGVYPTTPLFTEPATVGAGVTTMTVTLRPGRYFAVMTAFDSRGIESDKSDEIQFDVKPGKPTRLRFR